MMDDFFACWAQQIVAIDDYAYVGMDFRGDLDLPLPPDVQWGDIGTSLFILLIFFYF